MLSLTTRVKAIAKRCRLRQFAHDEDCRTEMSDAEIITTAMCAAMFFGGNHAKACNYMKEHKLIPNMLEKSRFNRRLHGISMLVNDLFHQLGMILKESSNCTEYLLDSCTCIYVR
jgi:hypothetical protein